MKNYQYQVKYVVPASEIYPAKIHTASTHRTIEGAHEGAYVFSRFNPFLWCWIWDIKDQHLKPIAPLRKWKFPKAELKELRGE